MCLMTQSAFVRLLSNPAFSSDALTVAEAAFSLATDSLRWPEEVDVAQTVGSFAG